MRQNDETRHKVSLKGLRLPVWILAVLVCTIFCTQSTSAQQLTNGQSQVVKLTPATQADVQKPSQQQAVGEQLPYLNYKGISDPEQAKESWIREHPEEYQALLKKSTQSSGSMGDKPSDK